MKVNLVWFRRELRLQDNQLLNEASRAESLILPIYIFDSYYLNHQEFSPLKQSFEVNSLRCFKDDLLELGANLRCFKGDPFEIIKGLKSYLHEAGYEPELLVCNDVQYEYDRLLYKKLEGVLPLHYCYNDFLITDQSQMNAWREKYYEYLNASQFSVPLRLNAFKSEDFLPFEILLPELHCNSKLFKLGETAAIERLNNFLRADFEGYHWKLSRPWQASRGATSHLSAHLAQGCISSRYVYQAVKKRRAEVDDKANFSLRAFVDRLRWRDSFRNRFFFHPEWATENRYPEFNKVYSCDPLDSKKLALYEAWKKGETGFLLLDASMRQLQTDGWINFRMRAMVASFLCLNCGVSWQWGAQHFMNCLIDGDVGIDHWQWQMQAGVINPLQETFRVYNPNKNFFERDPEALYVKHWLPELKKYSKKDLFNFAWNESFHPKPILNWSQTKAVYASQVSEIRKEVRMRLVQENNSDFVDAVRAKKTVQKFYENRNKEYLKLQSPFEQLKLDLEK